LLVGLVALAALGLYVGWMNRLSEEERQVVGTWYLRLPPSNNVSADPLVVLHYARDRTFSNANGHRSESGRWRVRDGKLIIDYSPDVGLVDRARRLLPPGFPGALPSAVPDTLLIERLTADELIVRNNFEKIIRMTRTPPE
jgi:hypothetical protein